MEATEYFSTQLNEMLAATWSKSIIFFEGLGLSGNQLSLWRLNHYKSVWNSYQVV